MSAAAEDGAAGEEGKTQGGRLLVGCSAALDGGLGLPEQVESHHHSQKGGLPPPSFPAPARAPATTFPPSITYTAASGFEGKTDLWYTRLWLFLAGQ